MPILSISEAARLAGIDRRTLQQRLLPPPRQGIIERIAEAIARLKRPKGNT